MNYKLLYQLEREENTKLKVDNQQLKNQIELLQFRIDLLKTKVELVQLPIVPEKSTKCSPITIINRLYNKVILC